MNEARFTFWALVLIVLSLSAKFAIGQGHADIGGVPAAARSEKNSIGIELVRVPAGSFSMGSSDTEDGRDKDEGPVRKVTIARDFYIGKYEVTQEEYQKVMGVNPSGFRDCARCPVETVSWDNTQEFIKRLNAKNDGFVYRLPTEAEWEYAARAGTKTPLSFGNAASPADANFDWRYPYGNGSKSRPKVKTVPVGSFKPNAFGIYDMHGNVWEWVEDVYDYQTINGAYQPRGSRGVPTDGSAFTSGEDDGKRVRRGGSYKSWGKALRSANRGWKNRRDANRDGGFRVVAVKQ